MITGDSSAVDKSQRLIAVYQRHVDTVYRVCYTFLHNAADSEDAVQNVFIKLLNKWVDFESEEHEKAWLIRVASNHCKDVLKNAWNRRTSLESIAEPLARDAEPDTTLEEVLKLPENQKVCVYLYYYEGYSAAEIAGIMERPYSTVRNYLSEARKELGRRLKGGFDE